MNNILFQLYLEYFKNKFFIYYPCELDSQKFIG